VNIVADVDCDLSIESEPIALLARISTPVELRSVEGQVPRIQTADCRFRSRHVEFRPKSAMKSNISLASIVDNHTLPETALYVVKPVYLFQKSSLSQLFTISI